MKINLTLNRDLFLDKYYPLLEDYSHKVELYMGGSASGKSFFICQKLILRALKQKIRILVCRKYLSTIKDSCFSLFKQIIEQWGLTPYVDIVESNYRIIFKHNGSEIIFKGLDEETKLLSLNEIGTVFVEEAFEIDKNMLDQLILRMRAPIKDSQIIMAWNPINKDSWLYDYAEINPPENSIYIKSTYRDNPHLPQTYLDFMEDMRTRNPQKYKVFGLGEWGVNNELRVFNNWRVEEFDLDDVKNFEIKCGVDFGWIDPSAACLSFYDKVNKRIYVYGEVYESGIQLDKLAELIKEMGVSRHIKIYCDNSEPRSIDYLKSQGLYAVACKKGQNSVKARVLFLQNNEIIIHPKCKNFINEIENLCYLKPGVEDMDHTYTHLCLDALGYGYSDIYTQRTARTIDKGVLGL